MAIHQSKESRSKHSPTSKQPTAAAAKAAASAVDDTDKVNGIINEKPQSVADWVQYLSDKEMSVLAGTLRQLNEISRDADAQISELSQIILRDPVLTSRVLKVANSALYKLGNCAITTISRAIVVLGFGVVRDIAISLKVMDSLVGEDTQEDLLQRLADSYHAAMQAKSLAQNNSASDQEEVFIAALLRQVGHFAFLSGGGETAAHYSELVANGSSPKQAASKSLGFDLERLTLALARAWTLGDLLTDVVINGESAKSKLAQAAVLGDQLSQTAKHGWDSPEFNAVMQKVARFSDRPIDECLEDVMLATKATKSQAIYFGADRLKHLIPDPITLDKSGVESVDKATSPMTGNAASARGDKDLQLEIIRDMNEMVKTGLVDLNAVLHMVMEAVHRGIGIDRVALCLITTHKAKRVLVGKASMGLVDEAWEKELRFELDDDTIFSYAVRYAEPMWMGSKSTLPLAYLITDSIKALVGQGHFFIAPIVSGAKPIGLIYADNRPTGAPLTEEAFLGFRLFSKQMEMCLKALRSKKN